MAGFTTRPVIMGTHGVVTSGHYLATAAGFRIMQQGGNAIDAAATMCFCLNLLEPQSNGIGGEVPTLIYSAPAREVFAISGMGWSPQAFTIDWCRAQGIARVRLHASDAGRPLYASLGFTPTTEMGWDLA